jgi:hypothetical protein
MVSGSQGTTGFLGWELSLVCQTLQPATKNEEPAQAGSSFCFSRTVKAGDLLFRGVSYRIQDDFKRRRVVERQIGQHLAVQTDAFSADGVDKTAVRDALGAGCGVDARNPQAAVQAFFELAVAVGVFPAFFEGVFGDGINLGPGAEVAACGQHDFFPARVAGRTVCCSWH